MTRWLRIWMVGLVLLLAAGCGESDDCGAVCQGICGTKAGCDCGECDGNEPCFGDVCNLRCEAMCDGLECGDDGCGGFCGTCKPGFSCQAGLCEEVCEPACEDLECGDDGCGGQCGECPGAAPVCAEGVCVPDCDPACGGKECGDDGCGGSCGDCPQAAPVCAAGLCVPDCEPDCNGKVCGSDGCDGSCGECAEHTICLEDGSCLCQPACEGKDCGDDGCDGTCGACDDEQKSCVDGICECAPACEGKECGDNGCGGVCGECPSTHQCLEDGVCICVPNCLNKECGGDGCTGLCGECECGEDCTLDGLCLFTACAGKECGADGCGGDCGSCPPDQYCVFGKCPADGGECQDDNEDNWDGCTGGELSEFRVNEFVAADQKNAAVAVLSGGGFVVVWESDGQDGSGAGVYGRLFAADGSSEVDEFQVSTETYGAQKKPAVAARYDGGFVVVWESAGQDGFLEGVFGQRYKAGGIPVGDEVQVNAYADFGQVNPAVIVFPGNDYLVCWQSKGVDGSDEGIVGRRFLADGTAVGPEYGFNSYILGAQHVPSLAAFDDGRMVATWASFQQDGNDWGIFGQRYDAAGGLEGVEFQVNTHVPKHQYYPSVSALDGGTFVVVWQSLGQDGPDYSIFGQRFGENNVSGAEFAVHASSDDKQERPTVGSNGGGAFVVAWESCPGLEAGSPGQDGSGCGVYTRHFDKKGAPQGEESLVNVFTAHDQSNAALAAFDDGSYVVTFESCPPAYAPPEGQDGDGCGVFARRFTKTGAMIFH